MTIALVAHDTKKELMVQFCIAYRQILSEHRLIATGTTGRLVAEATGLNVQRFLPGGHGSGNVGGNRNIVHIADAQQVHLVGLRGLSADGVTEEKQHVHFVAGDAGNDLLVTAVAAR